MNGFVDAAIEAYADEQTTAIDPALSALADETRAKLSSPRMLSGPVVGRLLELLVHATRARLVLELGTYSGFGSLSMAAGLPPEGRIVTCEILPEHADFARRHIEASPYADRIDIRLGPALETIAGLDGPYDFVFIDADKEGYVDYYEAVLPKLADHGLIAADNTLFSGRVLDPASDDDTAHAIARFNEHVARDDRVVCTLLTVRDGITLIRRR